MVRAVVFPYWTYFEGLTFEQSRFLSDSFAVEIPGIRFNKGARLLIQSKRWDGKVKFFDWEERRIHTGLLPKVQKVFGPFQIEDKSLEGVESQWIEAKERSKTVELNGIKLNERQRAAVVMAVEYRRGVLEMATGSGKTEVGAAIIKSLWLPTLWLVHKTDLLHQTADRLEARLGVPVGRIGDGQQSVGAVVTVAMMQSIKPNTKDGKKLLEKFNIFIADEAHHLAANTQQAVARGLSNAPFRYALAGTFDIGDKLKLYRIMSATDCTILYQLKNQEQIESGWSAKPTITIHRVEMPAPPIEVICPPEPEPDLDEEDEKQEPPLYGKIYDYMVQDNEQYHDIVADEIVKQYRAGKSTLVLVDRLRHGGALESRLMKQKIPHAYLTGSDPSSRRISKLAEFRTGKLPIVIATSIFDEGIDVPRVQALILCAGGKSTVRLLQRVGRALRRKGDGIENIAEIIDYELIGHRYLEKHSKLRQKIYKREGFEVNQGQTYRVNYESQL